MKGGYKEDIYYKELEKLNKELLNDSDLSEELKRFYRLQVNYNGDDPEKLEEMASLLRTIKEGWEGIREEAVEFLKERDAS